mmetsp:Transcript_126217/g.178108  ORF Transcript_126217/g.178108 Transcript_126217/m.178108 type:complete len:377 (-) Transcript_126217:52-1182(-)
MPDVGFIKAGCTESGACAPAALAADAQAFLKPSLSQKILGCGAQLWLHLHASLEDVSSRYRNVFPAGILAGDWLRGDGLLEGIRVFEVCSPFWKLASDQKVQAKSCRPNVASFSCHTVTFPNTRGSHVSEEFRRPILLSPSDCEGIPFKQPSRHIEVNQSQVIEVCTYQHIVALDVPVDDMPGMEVLHGANQHLEDTACSPFREKSGFYTRCSNCPGQCLAMEILQDNDCLSTLREVVERLDDIRVVERGQGVILSFDNLPHFLVIHSQHLQGHFLSVGFPLALVHDAHAPLPNRILDIVEVPERGIHRHLLSLHLQLRPGVFKHELVGHSTPPLQALLLLGFEVCQRLRRTRRGLRDGTSPACWRIEYRCIPAVI